MKNSFKRVTSMVLTLAMLFSFIPSSFAVEDNFGSNEDVVNNAENVVVKQQTEDDTGLMENVSSDVPTGSENSEYDGVADGFAPVETKQQVDGNDEITAHGADMVSPQTTKVVYYVANSTAGGSDTSGDGSETNPYMTIGKAIASTPADADEIDIVLKSDIEASQELKFEDATKTINFTSDGDTHRIQFTGSVGIGTESGFIKVINGATVNFDNVDLYGSSGTYDGRVIYVADNGTVSLSNLTVSRGRVNNVSNNQGGAGAMAADRGTLNVNDGVTFKDNTTTAGGGAIFVANGGLVNIYEDAQITNNTAALGAGVYVDTQTESYGGLHIYDSVQITGNKASQHGSGMYICKSANATVKGNVVVNDNKNSGVQDNVYLDDDATLDIAGTTVNANIGINANPEEAYRLISRPSGYDIIPTKNGDEKGWHDDCGTWDIRHMTYNGVEGLYLYYKTLNVTFEDVNTLTNIEGKDINGEDVDFINDTLPSVSKTGGVLTAADTVAKNTPEDDDLSFTIKVNKDEYRIPTKDVIHVTSGGKDVEYTYTPDFANGTATITVDDAIVDTLTDTIKFEVSGEKYYTLTIRSEGPLYAMKSSITGLTESKLVIAEQGYQGSTATYKLVKDSASGRTAAAGVQIALYDSADYAGNPVAMETTDETGVAIFTGLTSGKTYYAVLYYERQYRVISRDLTKLTLSTLNGQSLASTCATDAGATGHVTYDASTGNSTITGITSDALVTYRINQVSDTIIFHGNEGDATTAPATLSMESKKMGADANVYGELATASMVGYDFDGWFTEAEGGEQVTPATRYQTGVSTRQLYAHWTARTDTKYTIKHWVEYAEGGANARYTEAVATKVVNGVKYYLYRSADWNDGTSDAVKDISNQDLKTMADAELTWWSRDGFTVKPDTDCKVLANGNAIFDIYYDRNVYKLNFDSAGEGSVTSPDTFPSKDVKFGALVGTLPTPRMPGYAFGGWYDGDRLVTSTTIYNKAENTDLTGHWIARDDTNWAIKIAVQDIVRDPDTGVYSAADTYTEYKTVYKDNNGALLSYKLTGTTDTDYQFAISSISDLTFEGFNYVGYANAYDRNATGMTADATNATVTIKPTDASTEVDGEYNDAFDGGVVWLYYNRKTADVKPNPTEPGGNTDGGKIIYGGDFAGQLPPDPSKPGYDFNGWVDKDGDDITPTTPADKYVEAGNTITVTPKWTPRDYTLTYVPGEGASFVASDGGAGTVNNNVPGGYQDSHTVTYDQAMGTMPTASKPGYNFVGWFLEDGTTQVTTDTVVTIDNVIVKNAANTYEETRPLYAKFTPHHYTLVFNPGSDKQGNSGTVAPKKLTITYDEILANLPTPVLTGYTFVSWMLDLRDPASAFKNGDKWTTVLTDGAEIPVYATYVANSYKYTFDLNDQTGSTRASLIDTSIDHTEEIYDKFYNGLFDVEATRSGYDFKGWSLVKNGDVLTADDMVRLAQDTTVYAKWQPKKYNVKFVMRGSAMPDTFDQTTGVYDAAADTWTVKVDFDSVYGTLPVPTKTDAKYHGWLAAAANWEEIDNEIILELPQYTDYKDEDGITLTAVMEPWITFDPNGNKFVDNDSTDPRKELQSEIDKLPEVKKDDFTFDGWVKENEPDKVLTIDDVKKLEEPTVLKPKFSANITFNANGGVVTTNNAGTYVVGISKITTLPSASKSGYVFNGWFTAVSGGTQVTYDGLKTANVPATVYAQYTIRSSGGGGGGGGGAVSSNTITVKQDDGVTVTPTPDKNGKVTVVSGSDKEFKFKADKGYVITDVIVDGKSQGALDSYKFTKVRENHTLEVKVAKMLTGDHIAYIKGYPDGGVHPNANITRAEVSAIFYRLLTDDARKQYAATSSSFADANKSWAAAEIATLTNAGILKGYSDGTFRPDAAITRAEFASIAARFDKLSGGNKTFSDVPTNHWAYAAITSAAEKGWVNGYSDGTFRPSNAITRSEVVKITNAVLGRSCDKDFAAKNMKKLHDYNDINAAYWAYYEILEASNAHDYKTVSGVESWTTVK